MTSFYGGGAGNASLNKQIKSLQEQINGLLEDVKGLKIKATEKAELPSLESELSGLNKQAKDLITEETILNDAGDVIGPLHYIEGWIEFNSVDPDEQNGHYFPLHLKDNYKGKSIRVTSQKQTVEYIDQDWVLRVDNIDSTFKFETEGKEIFTLNFKKATLEEPIKG